MMSLDYYSSGGMDDYKNSTKEYSFQPYSDNGGNVVAIGGDDFAVIACDTRLSSGYTIHTREQNKLFKLTDKTILGSSGCWCDVLNLTQLLKIRLQTYEYDHHKTMSTPAVAQMLSTIMYYRRFFPYYVSNILAGLDENGKGIVYSYDPVGHCEASKYRAGGSAGAQLQPLLDNQIGMKNQEGLTNLSYSLEKAILCIKDVFISAAERDIYTGDGMVLNIITKDGVRVESLPLRKD